MTETKWAETPWKVDEKNPGDIKDAKGDYIAHVWARSGSSQRGNMDLLLNAPQLYAALEALYEVGVPDAPGLKIAARDAAYGNAKAALKAARGEG